jgi:hypothetical protein
MKLPLRGGAVSLLLLLGVLTAGALVPGARSEREEKPAYTKHIPEPGGTTEAAGLAAQDPDQYAWRLFLFLNRQARPGKAGEADPAKRSVLHYDADKDVVWETWALASADSLPEGSEVFLAAGAEPLSWEKLARGKRPSLHRKLDLNFTTVNERLATLDAAALRSGQPLRDLLGEQKLGVEVRMNRSTFDTIRDNGWYSREGLAATFKKGKEAGNRDFFQFQAASKVVKASWRTIEESQKPRYHWRTIGDRVYGLMAFHLVTKDLPQWFWCDFIHADVVQFEPPGSLHDTTTRGPGALHGKDGVRDETAGSKWANYLLKGTQTAFTDPRGNPTHLGNTVLEGLNVARSSCITCHAMAAIDANGKKMAFGRFPVGVPQSSLFGDTEINYLQTDFLFTMVMRAHSTSEKPPSR